MNQSLGIAFLIISLATFMIYLIIVIYYKSFHIEKRDFSFKNSYPYELYMKMPIPLRVITYIVLFISIGLGAVGLVLAFNSLSTTYSAIIGWAYAISFICLGISNVLPLSFYKSHLLFALLGLFGFAFSSILLCFITIVQGGMFPADSLPLAVVIIIGVLGFATLIAAFNPKLLSWARMDKTEENGTTYYVKPKFNYLALYEWILLILFNISDLMIMISLLT